MSRIEKAFIKDGLCYDSLLACLDFAVSMHGQSSYEKTEAVLLNAIDAYEDGLNGDFGMPIILPAEEIIEDWRNRRCVH